MSNNINSQQILSTCNFAYTIFWLQYLHPHESPYSLSLSLSLSSSLSLSQLLIPFVLHYIQAQNVIRITSFNQMNEYHKSKKKIIHVSLCMIEKYHIHKVSFTDLVFLPSFTWKFHEWVFYYGIYNAAHFDLFWLNSLERKGITSGSHRASRLWHCHSFLSITFSSMKPFLVLFWGKE